MEEKKRFRTDLIAFSYLRYQEMQIFFQFEKVHCSKNLEETERRTEREEQREEEKTFVDLIPLLMNSTQYLHHQQKEHQLSEMIDVLVEEDEMAKNQNYFLVKKKRNDFLVQHKFEEVVSDYHVETEEI